MHPSPSSSSSTSSSSSFSIFSSTSFSRRATPTRVIKRKAQSKGEGKGDQEDEEKVSGDITLAAMSLWDCMVEARLDMCYDRQILADVILFSFSAHSDGSEREREMEGERGGGIMGVGDEEVVTGASVGGQESSQGMKETEGGRGGGRDTVKLPRGLQV